ncbi:alpha/beta fold hydrolase domain-containing protein [Alcaligenes parafaecalis]|uniref:Alpha/beta hydrolase n=1 Tax=Alcaligenes parafaecalis TaxID=171260 RepID=A0ABT3VNE6_9BURK|nr:alpha/beta hydrolase [Alcaligenes parafaecalis]MCX5465024.1 alpha/beta hydrolase [Alcaligenes parafaecalis]
MDFLHSLARLAGFGIFLGVGSLAQAQPQAHDLARANGTAIRYYIQPAAQPQAGERELLLIVQGSDCNSVAHKSLLWDTLAQARPQADVLAVEKYALNADLPVSDKAEREDCPADYIRHDQPRQRVADLDAVLTQIQARQAYGKVFALGGSEGAVIVHLLAAQTSHLDVVVSFNGGGRWFEDDVLYSAASEEMPAADKEVMLDGLRSFLKQARAGMEITMSDHGGDWWQQMLSLDQAAVLRGIRIPALLIQSGRDTSVSPQAAAEMFAQVNNPHLVWNSYPELDHAMNQPDGHSAMPQVVADIARWLSQAEKTKP